MGRTLIKQICALSVTYDIEKRLRKQLPETLEKAYAEIYKNIRSAPGSSPQLAETALPFSPEALVLILSLGFPAANCLDTGGLLMLGQILLTLVKELNVVRFAHLSTRGFLEKMYFTITDEDSMASTVYLTYLMNPANAMEIRKRRAVIYYGPYSAI